MKNIAVLYTKYTPTIDAVKYRLKEYKVDAVTEIQDASKYDLVILCGYEGTYNGNALMCHHSLLPAFNSKEPEKDAIIGGVKVTGITIRFTNPERIVAQYPVFITNSMHYEELKQELEYLEQTIFPLVINKVLENEPFELQSLINKGCNGNCGGCSSCSH